MVFKRKHITADNAYKSLQTYESKRVKNITKFDTFLNISLSNMQIDGRIIYLNIVLSNSISLALMVKLHAYI